ncbi:hypothetical protein ACWGRL_21605 [[Kitasatospora] papulosa]
MTTMHPRDDQDQNLPAPTLLNSTIEDLLVQIEHEATCRRREARALRRRIQRQHRRERPMHIRVAQSASKACSAGLALIGVTAFVAAGVCFFIGEVTTAKQLLTLASAAWSGAAGVVIFSRR